jgi:hypothetical protein
VSVQSYQIGIDTECHIIILHDKVWSGFPCPVCDRWLCVSLRLCIGASLLALKRQVMALTSLRLSPLRW